MLWQFRHCCTPPAEFHRHRKSDRDTECDEVPARTVPDSGNQEGDVYRDHNGQKEHRPLADAATHGIDGLGQRIQAIPLPEAVYSNLQAAKTGELYYLKSNAGFNRSDSGGAHHTRRRDGNGFLHVTGTDAR